MKVIRYIAIVLICLFVIGATPALVKASIVWNWDFSTESGQFVTDDGAPTGPPGETTYTVTDFSVTTTGFGFPLGSVGGGVWVMTVPSPPYGYEFVWDGSVVTQWIMTDPPLMIFASPSFTDPYFYVIFGESLDDYDPADAIAVEVVGAGDETIIRAAGPVSVKPVPVPPSVLLLMSGLITGAGLRKRFKR